MDKRNFFTIAAVIAAVLATLAALTTVSRAIGKIDPELMRLLKPIFWYEALPALVLGVTFVVAAIFLAARHRRFAIFLLLLAPLAAMLLGMALLR